MTSLAFVLGCPRSGTTFLLNALQPLPHVEALSGLVFPPHLAHLAAATSDPSTADVVQASFTWSLGFFADHAARSRGWVVGEWTKGNSSTREVLATVRGRRRLDTLVYKEPFLAFAPRLAYDAAPDARLVLIHRDGRDCADSLERKYGVLTDDRLRALDSVEAPLGRRVDDRYVPWWVAEADSEAFLAASPYLRSVWMWREMARRCTDFLDDPEVRASGRVLVVRYDDLVGNPVEVGRRIVEHIGHQLDRRTRRRFGRGHGRSVGIHAGRAPEEVAAATELARPELVRWGYVEGRAPGQDAVVHTGTTP